MIEMTAQERLRLFAATWETAGPLLEEFRWEEARGRTEAEKWEWANELQMTDLDSWPRPLQPDHDSGLLDQQRLFKQLPRG